ncbi:hypothetical protein E4P54_16540 [Salmonella enterica subsp. enterica serovar Panama]|uniref:hypothetical protein n=1 Tax=Enterobacteriaceae TaxID=543 RepID=UPI00147311AD|nr:hypothetical protein [Salmonella enterica]EGO0259841.1 hypothetical protein [Salmonella enterica subsp. enterica serovar Panama]EGP7450145.1 hypothetical protein [Salmonella enterica subsp. enterica serovar Panama]NMF70710.1 hypothetical protein [Salmonella enterica subsp. enterica serovar Panama]NMF75434.1 hypothetical protein [Salmonella enterica subsp. enterica serovar Panama]NMF80159.1 hypothetical protein [Salmonella enterica subsp. enterica serovar Panama]
MTDENQIKVLFCILRRRFVDYVPEFENCVEEREVINETPKGYRMSVSYGTSVYLHADYEFFESRQAAYQWCARRVTASIEKMKQKIQAAEATKIKLIEASGELWRIR